MAGSINARMGFREWTMLLTLSVLWGGSFFFVEVAVAELAPLTVVTLRVSLAACALWTYGACIGLRVPRSVRIWLSFLVMGLVNNVLPFSLIAWGQTEIASGLASILNATTPLFTVMVAGLLLADERMTGLKVIGVCVGFTGVVAMIGPTVLGGLGRDVVAQVAVLTAALCYALGGVFGRRFRAMGISPVITAAGQVSASSMILMPLALIAERPWESGVPSAGVWAAVFGLALLSTAVAYVLYFRVLASAGATNLLLVTFLIPASAIGLGIVFLGESLALSHVVGIALIALGLSAIDGRLWRRFGRAGADVAAEERAA